MLCRSRGERLSWASIRSQISHWRFCNLVMYNNRKQTLADQGLSSSKKAVAAQLDACTGRQACSGRHPATVSPSVITVACWNIRHLRIQTDEDGTTPRKTSIIDLELNQLNIDIATLSKTWLTGSGSIREEHYTFFWNRHPEGKRMRHGVSVAVRNCLMTCIEYPRNLSPCLSPCEFASPKGV